MTILITLASIILITLIIGAIIYIKYYFPLRPRENGFDFVYIEIDGTVRELHSDEQDYLTTDFLPNDGGRPYVKSNYNEEMPDGKISGYIRRRRVPKGIIITKLKEPNN